ncbi:MAG: hypothetical protein QNJ63_03385 [Calothrix sp. MO_192.B10]|nr:hypothetical protein [Calothrix sp. MO_192.B10]
MRYLSDEEKIRSVFDYQNARSELPINFKYYEHIKYESFDEYIKENPDCCKINPPRGSDLPPPRFSDRIFGYHSGELIVINFKVRYIDDSGKRRIKEIRIDRSLHNCGKIFSWN